MLSNANLFHMSTGLRYYKGALAGGSAPRTPQKVGCLPAASRALGPQGPGALRSLGPWGPGGPWALEAAGRQPTFWGVIQGAEPPWRHSQLFC